MLMVPSAILGFLLESQDKLPMDEPKAPRLTRDSSANFYTIVSSLWIYQMSLLPISIERLTVPSQSIFSRIAKIFCVVYDLSTIDFWGVGVLGLDSFAFSGGISVSIKQ